MVFSVQCLLPVSRPEVAAGRGGCAAGVKAAAGHLTGLTAHAAHAGLYAAGLGCGGYRFLVTRTEDGRSMAIFLECSQSRRAVRGQAAASAALPRAMAYDAYAAGARQAELLAIWQSLTAEAAS